MSPTRRLVTVVALATALLTGSALVATAADATAPDRARATRVSVVRPVTAEGVPAPGWQVTRQRHGAVNWEGSSVSAVDDDITTCYPSAEYLPSCWRSAHHTVLCVRDVTSQRLVRVRYRGSYPSSTPPARPTPQALTLAGGARCSIRIGGAWGTVPSHPRWLGFILHVRVGLRSATWTASTAARPAWRVHLVDSDGSVTTRVVRRAYQVGTARG